MSAKIYDFEKTLQPMGVLKWFKKICTIPHGSFHEIKLSRFLQSELKKSKCQVKEFKSGAFLAYKGATKGYEKLPCVMLQAHLDMVLVSEENLKINLLNNPIKPYYDPQLKILKAERTSLGADNGIGVAMIMEILTNPSVQHGPIECLCTTGEEVDSSICMESIPNGVFKAQQIINLDSEKDDTICIGSGACRALKAKHKIKFASVPKQTRTYEIKLSNFKGGHSGILIHLPHINVIQMIAKSLMMFGKKNSFNIVSWYAGDAQNCIPKSSWLTLQLDSKKAAILEKMLIKQLVLENNIVQNNDQDATVKMSLAKKQSKVALSWKDSYQIMQMLALLPNGMFTYSKLGKCMFNSSNLGIVKIGNQNLYLEILARSLLDVDATQIIDKISEYLQIFGLKVNEIKINYDDCYAWLVLNPMNSSLIQTWRKNYISVYKKEPKIMPTAGGLEVAAIIKKAPKLEQNSLSCGPTICYPHSTQEHCFVESINKIWTILLKTLKSIK